MPHYLVIYLIAICLLKQIQCFVHLSRSYIHTLPAIKLSRVSVVLKSEANSALVEGLANLFPAGTTYCMCGNCKTAYQMNADKLSPNGLRVQCGLCNKEWFQTVDRLLKTGDAQQLIPMPDIKVDQVKRILTDRNVPKYPGIDKFGIFVGNLPYSFTEKEIGELFAEYGIINLSLVKDDQQQSKGFAFIDVSSKADADLLLSEMSDFYVEPGRKLTVRMSTTGSTNNRDSPDIRRQSPAPSAASSRSSSYNSRYGSEVGGEGLPPSSPAAAGAGSPVAGVDTGVAVPVPVPVTGLSGAPVKSWQSRKQSHYA